MKYRKKGYIKLKTKIKSTLQTLSIFTLIFVAFSSCNPKESGFLPGDSIDSTGILDSVISIFEPIPLDSTLIAPFFESYPKLKKYEKELLAIYQSRSFTYVWFDQEGLVVYGNSLYNKVKDIETEGVYSTFPYQEKIDSIYQENTQNAEDHPEMELLFTSLYLYYVSEVYKGIDTSITEIGWLLPRKKMSYTALLDSIIADKKLKHKNSSNLFRQYYQLRDALNRFQTLEKNGGWNPIEPEADRKTYQPNDSSEVIQQIRERLFITGEIEHNNKSNIYDEELLVGINKFQLHNGYKSDSIISAKHITALNIPVNEYIKKIIVNMERCRWVPPRLTIEEEFIFVNIPAYKLSLFRNGKLDFDSPVVVGNVMTKTVIFEGMMTYIVFSPYWNIPQSIIRNEVVPGMEKDKNYLSKRNMEWNNGKVRQRPGKNNSLGLVKFIFPNSNSIYLHDSPAKSLFQNEDRARSHGCIRVGKAREMALNILQDDEDWPVERIDKAMNAGKESTCVLKEGIPVYIGYFTAWVDREGQINFYKDVYNRDERLAAMLFYKE